MKSLLLFSQKLLQIDNATQVASQGKSGVVIAVITVLFAGIVIYLVSLDRKIRKLEK